MKKLKTLWTLIAFPFVIPVLANDASQEQGLPSYVQTINAKCDKQTDSASHLYWQTALLAHRSKLKELRAAMVRAANQNDAAAIPLIQKEIDETEERVAGDSTAAGVPPAPATDMKWLEGTRWLLDRDSKQVFIFNSDHTLEGADHGTWNVLDANTIALKREHLADSIWTFSKSRRQAMDESAVGKWVGSIFFLDRK